ncbi:hypothetical protein OPQ81_001142 [Rhizoctonia solani]|nr:hypothetical protein OPQ81_001142 [Rhizoctonia solani]
MVGRWVEEISTYAFKLRHVRAPQHTVPDGLSRRPRAPEDTESSESEREQQGESRIVTMARLDGWVETARGLGAQYEGDLEPELEAVNRFLANLERPGALDEEESRSLVRKARVRSGQQTAMASTSGRPASVGSAYIATTVHPV